MSLLFLVVTSSLKIARVSSSFPARVAIVNGQHPYVNDKDFMANELDAGSVIVQLPEWDLPFA